MRNPSSSRSKTKTPCCSKVGIKRGPWTQEEDELLANYIKREGEGRWRMLPIRAGLLRCGKSCRLRWMNYLRPTIKRGRIAPDEEDLILRLHRLLGNRWSLIAGRIPGRTDNEIKNYWNTHLSKKLISQGIDPRTHKPLILNPNPSPDPSEENLNPSPDLSEQNPNPLESSHEAASGSSHQDVPCKSSEDWPVTQMDGFQLIHNQTVDTAGLDNNLQDCNGFMMGLRGCHGHSSDHEDYMGNFNEDTFSSFFDSLINDNIFTYQPQGDMMYPIVSSSAAEAFNHASIGEAQVGSTSTLSNYPS